MGVQQTPKNVDPVRKQALYWLATFKTGAASPEDRQAFEKWRGADARHRDAFASAEHAWETLRESEQLKKMAAKLTGPPAQHQPHAGVFFGGLARRFAIPKPQAFAAPLVAASIVAISVPVWSEFYGAHTHQTETSEIRNISLPDASVVHLAPESRIRVRYTDRDRRVELITGEAFFDVKPDTNRVFTVSAGDAEITVVGTKFNVNHSSSDSLAITVAQGKVSVRQQPASFAPAFSRDRKTKPATNLTAGEQLVSRKKTGAEEVLDMEPRRAGAWRSGYLFYGDNTLREVLSDVNRYSEIPILVEEKSLNNLRITAAFSTTQLGDMLDGIEGVLPVVIDRSDPDRIIIRKIASG